jgi:hypothetical protein
MSESEKKANKEEIIKTLKDLKSAMYKRKVYLPKRYSGNRSMNLTENTNEPHTDIKDIF